MHYEKQIFYQDAGICFVSRENFASLFLAALKLCVLKYAEGPCFLGRKSLGGVKQLPMFLEKNAPVLE